MSSEKEEEQAHTGGFAPLKNRDFCFLLSGFAIGQMLMPLQFVTQILWVQTYAPPDIWLILVAFIGASRGMGALLFGLYGGALADRFDRRKLLIAIQFLLILTTVLISALMFFSIGSTLGFILFFALTFLSAGLLSIDAPTRLAIIPDILGPRLTPAGMALSQTVGQLSIPLAMFGVGLIIDRFGFSGAYLISASGHVIAIFCIALMAYQSPLENQQKTLKGYRLFDAIADIRQGFDYTRQHATVFWIIMLVFSMMLLGFPATANFGPTWITTVVGVPIPQVGFIIMNWGIGALVASLTLTHFASIERRGLVLVSGALLFAVSFMIFVSDKTVTNVVIGNLGLGAGMAMTMISSTVLIQHLVPNEIRGRIMSLLQLNMGFAQLMTMPVALLGQWLTLPVLFPVMSVVTLIVVLMILITQPVLRRARIHPRQVQLTPGN